MVTRKCSYRSNQNDNPETNSYQELHNIQIAVAEASTLSSELKDAFLTKIFHAFGLQVGTEAQYIRQVAYRINDIISQLQFQAMQVMLAAFKVSGFLVQSPALDDLVFNYLGLGPDHELTVYTSKNEGDLHMIVDGAISDADFDRKILASAYLRPFRWIKAPATRPKQLDSIRMASGIREAVMAVLYCTRLDKSPYMVDLRLCPNEADVKAITDDAEREIEKKKVASYHDEVNEAVQKYEEFNNPGKKKLRRGLMSAPLVVIQVPRVEELKNVKKRKADDDAENEQQTKRARKGPMPKKPTRKQAKEAQVID